MLSVRPIIDSSAISCASVEHVFDEGGDPFRQGLVVLAPGIGQRQEDLSPRIECGVAAEPVRLAALLLRPIDFTTPSGQRVRRSAQTSSKAEASELQDRLRTEAWRRDKLAERRRHTWNEAVVRWCREQAHKATAEEDESKLRWLDRHLGGQDLDAIDRDMLEVITQSKKELKRRVRYLTREDATRLLAELPPHLHPKLPLARPAAHVAKLARTGRDSAARAAGVGQLGELRHGITCRALRVHSRKRGERPTTSLPARRVRISSSR